jgi:thiamine biosynthesis lipoprotein
MLRRFARVSGLFGAVAVLAGVAGCASRPAAPLARFEYTRPQMGVPFRIVLYAATQRQADAAARAAFTRIEQLNALLSDYEEDSELSRLSATAGQGQAVPVSEDLWRVLAAGQRLAAQTDGAFDLTAGPVVTLWRRARRQHRLPEPERLAAARAAVGYRHLELNARDRSARLLVPGMRLDLGGIAKGYAVDEALKTLRAHGLTRALVSGGGDLVVGDPPPGTKGWRIEVAPLDAPGAPPARFVRLQHRALATSGDVFQHVEIDGVRYSHIVDPRTGVGLTDHSLVTVIARNGLTADALATAVSVLGPKAGLRLVERTAGAAAYIVRQPGENIEAVEARRFRRFLAD